MRNFKYGLAVVVLGAVLISCGKLADKDQFIIANYQDEVIRRKDIKEWLRNLPDSERPLIQTQDDLLAALNNYINKRIMKDLAKELRNEKKISVERDEAREVYFEKNPDYATVYHIQDPTQADFTPHQVKAMKAEIEFGIDDELEVLYQEEAHRFYTREMATNESITVTQEELAVEFQTRRSEFMTFEMLDFMALVFQTPKEAAAIRQRIHDGESFSNVFEEIRVQNPQFAIRRVFQNNPAQEKFKQFWYNVAGGKAGDVFGPLGLPEHDIVGQTQDGRTASQKFPASYIVLEVVERQEPREKALDEAGVELTVEMLLAKSMEKLRDSYGVEIFRDKLYRPEGFGKQYEGDMINTGVN